MQGAGGLDRRGVASCVWEGPCLSCFCDLGAPLPSPLAASIGPLGLLLEISISPANSSQSLKLAVPNWAPPQPKVARMSSLLKVPPTPRPGHAGARPGVLHADCVSVDSRVKGNEDSESLWPTLYVVHRGVGVDCHDFSL